MTKTLLIAAAFAAALLSLPALAETPDESADEMACSQQYHRLGGHDFDVAFRACLREKAQAVRKAYPHMSELLYKLIPEWDFANMICGGDILPVPHTPQCEKRDAIGKALNVLGYCRDTAREGDPVWLKCSDAP
jgi:hypothetical protein